MQRIERKDTRETRHQYLGRVQKLNRNRNTNRRKIQQKNYRYKNKRKTTVTSIDYRDVLNRAATPKYSFLQFSDAAE